MQTKLCTKCQLDKPISTFFPRKAKKAGTKTSWCKDCMAARKHEDRAAARAFVYRYLLEHPCVDCGERDPVVLDFDHITPSVKGYKVSYLASQGLKIKTIEQEIELCEVRCANCHRRRTAKQFGWYDRTLKTING